jgi:D-amino-acid dehydrogenase
VSEVIVIGGGIVGACCALELERRGASVTVVEKGAGWAAGCSRANAGNIAPRHAAPLATLEEVRRALRWMFHSDSPFGLRPRLALLPWLLRLLRDSAPAKARRTTEVGRALAARSLELHAQLEEELGTSFRQAGLLDVYETAAGLEAARRRAELHAEAGFDPRVLDSDELREAEPLLEGEVSGAVLYPHEAYCDPLAFVSTVGRAAEAAGARLVPQTEVRRIRSGERIVVETAGEPLEADVAVIAAGAWSPGVAASLGARLPVEGAKGYVVDFVDDELPSLRRPIILLESQIALTPLEGRLRAAGVMVLEGLDERIDERRAAGVRASAARLVPRATAARVVQTGSGLRPCTPDGLPLVGWLAGNVAIAAGHARLGVTTGPGTGELVADLLDGRPNDLLPALDPRRYRAAVAA